MSEFIIDGRVQAIRDYGKMSGGGIRDLVGDRPLILEIGCCECDDTANFLRAMPEATIHCFEPDERALAAIPDEILQHPRVALWRCALGDSNEKQDWHASTGKAGSYEDWYLSGSLNEPTGHLAQSPEIKFKAPEPVSCLRLDAWYHTHIIKFAEYEVPGVDFIWADVQGAQVKLIAGGRKTLALTRYLYIECHPTPLYEGEPTQQELISMLPGFEPLGLYEGYNILFRNRHTL